MAHDREPIVDHPCERDLADALAQADIDGADNAEVDDSDASAGLDEQVAGVRIAVEEAVLEDRLRRHARRTCRECPPVDVCGIERLESLTLIPRSRSSVSTRDVVVSQKTRGICRSASPDLPRRHRLEIEARERLLGSSAELLDDRLAGGVAGNGRGGVLQLPQLRLVRGRQEVAPRREELAELGERGRAPRAPARPSNSLLLGADVPGASRRLVTPIEAIDEGAQSTARQRRRNLAVAGLCPVISRCSRSKCRRPSPTLPCAHSPGSSRRLRQGSLDR